MYGYMVVLNTASQFATGGSEAVALPSGISDVLFPHKFILPPRPRIL